jgi:hypothetical protein
MPGSLYPTCVQTVLAYKPKKKSKLYQTSSSNSSSRVSSSSSGSSDEEEPSAQTSTESSISDTIGSPDEDSDSEGIEPQAIPNQDHNNHGSEDSKNGDNPTQNNNNSDTDPSSSSDVSGGSNSDEEGGEYEKSKKSSSNKEDYANRLKKKERLFKYEPIYLDDSTFGQGKHVHVVSLPSYKMSILPFVNP